MNLLLYTVFKHTVQLQMRVNNTSFTIPAVERPRLYDAIHSKCTACLIASKNKKAHSFGLIAKNSPDDTVAVFCLDLYGQTCLLEAEVIGLSGEFFEQLYYAFFDKATI